MDHESGTDGNAQPCLTDSESARQPPGADFVKQQQLSGLSSGSPATPAQLGAATSLNYKAQFTVGVNIPIKAAATALSKTTKTAK